MIRYALKCAEGHDFDAWFRESAAYEAQKEAGLLGCAVCGSQEVEKSIMAPAVTSGTRAAPEQPVPLARPASPQEGALAELRQKMEAVSDYVGPDFAAEARRIHAGEAEQRPILGEASPAEAKALTEEGIPVAPVPWMVKRNA